MLYGSIVSMPMSSKCRWLDVYVNKNDSIFRVYLRSLICYFLYRFFLPWLFPHSCIRQKQQKSNYFNAVRSFMHSNHTTRWNLFMECTAYAYKHYGCFMQTFIVFIVYQFVGTLANFLICSSKNCAVSTHRIVGVFLIYVLRSFLCTDH